MSNIVKAVFGGTRTARTRHLYQYDYGQILQFIGIELPDAYEVHFSNSETGEAKIQIGDTDGVDIPDEYLVTGLDIYAWVFLHNTNQDGETKYLVHIPVKERARPTDGEPTPEQQSAITQAIALLNGTIEEVEGYAEEARETIETVRGYAEDAESYKDTVHADATTASEKASEASQSAQSAETAKIQAQTSATSAKTDADRAEAARDIAIEYGLHIAGVSDGMVILQKGVN